MTNYHDGMIKKISNWLLLAGISTVALGANKVLKAGSFYSWDVSSGAIAVSVRWESFEGVLRGTLKNTTSLTVRLATNHLRQYRQPLSGVIVESVRANVSNVPPQNEAVYDAIGMKTSVGCSVVLDSVEIYFEDASGKREMARLKTGADASPYWYGGPGCYWEEKKYKKSQK